MYGVRCSSVCGVAGPRVAPGGAFDVLCRGLVWRGVAWWRLLAPSPSQEAAGRPIWRPKLGLFGAYLGVLSRF